MGVEYVWESPERVVQDASGEPEKARLERRVNRSAMESVEAAEAQLAYDQTQARWVRAWVEVDGERQGSIRRPKGS